MSSFSPPPLNTHRERPAEAGLVDTFCARAADLVHKFRDRFKGRIKINSFKITMEVDSATVHALGGNVGEASASIDRQCGGVSPRVIVFDHPDSERLIKVVRRVPVSIFFDPSLEKPIPSTRAPLPSVV